MSATLELTVSYGIHGSPIKDAPVILYNPNMTIGRIGFTDADGKCTFTELAANRYLLMIFDACSRRYQVVEQAVNGTPLTIAITFPTGPDDKGKIKATVQVGGRNASGKPVKLYVHGGSTVIAQDSTNPNGEVIFNGLVGVYDVEAIAGPGPSCGQRKGGYNVPIDDNVVVTADFTFPAGC